MCANETKHVNKRSAYFLDRVPNIGPKQNSTRPVDTYNFVESKQFTKLRKFGERFPHNPYINFTCMTVILTLLHKERAWIEFQSQNVSIINVWGGAEILPNFVNHSGYRTKRAIW